MDRLNDRFSEDDLECAVTFDDQQLPEDGQLPPKQLSKMPNEEDADLELLNE